MSSRYTVRLRCRIDRRCPRCRAEYRTHVGRKLDADGESPEAAARLAAARAGRELAATADPHPCPACGRLPTDVVNRRQRSRHLLATGIGLFLLFAVWLVLSGGWAGLLAATAVALTASAHGLILLRPTETEPTGDRRDDIEILADGTPDRPRPLPTGRTGWHVVGVVGTLAAGFVALTPAVADRPADTVKVKPGEPVRVEFAESFDCLDDDWSAVPKITVRNRGDFPDRVPEVAAVSRRPDDKPTVPPPRQTVRPWADLTPPEDPALAARPLRLRIDLDVTYRATGGRRTLTASRELTLEVAASSAGGRLRSVSVGTLGLLFAGVMVLAAGLFLRTLSIPDPGDKPEVQVDEVAVAPADRDARPAGTGRATPRDSDGE